MRWIALSLALAGLASAAEFTWRTAPAGEHGFDTAKLDALREDLAGRRTRALLIIRHDRIVCEWYAAGSGPEQLQGTASLAKALVGGMSLMLALNDGRLRVDDAAARYIAPWRDDPRKSRITIRQLATHSAGIEDAEEGGLPHERLPGWKGAFWRRDPDPFSVAIHDAPVLDPPGSRFAYSNPGMAALAWAVTASLQGTAWGDIRELLRARILRPIGASDAEWRIGYGKAYEVEGLRLWANWGGGAFTPRTAARLARLMLRGGEWEGGRLVDRKWVTRMVTDAGTPRPARERGEPEPASGLCWWTNADGVWKGLPRDAFAGAGAGHEVVLVAPSLDLIVVRNGGLLTKSGEAEGFWGALVKYLFQPVMAAVRAAP